MNHHTVFDIIKTTIRDVVPGMKGIAITEEDSFKSHNINSIERMEVNMLLLEEAGVDIPRVELLRANTFGELAGMISQKLIS